mmetsp:Transcript_35569/g.65221  ORF Transcript_35569/g.65221 Transcript_35569/m.65221 type:complete len:86 (+) Transcript_35569:68-325(+)
MLCRITFLHHAGSLIFPLLSELPQQLVLVLTTSMLSSNHLTREGPIRNSLLNQEVQASSYKPQQRGGEMVGRLHLSAMDFDWGRQ